MRKLATKPFFVIAIVIIAILIISSVFFNVLLAKNKDNIEKAVEKYLDAKFFTDNIIYFPPNFIIARNVSLFSDKSIKSEKVLFVPILAISVSIPKLLKKEAIAISDLRLYKPQITYRENISFLKEKKEGKESPMQLFELLSMVNNIDLFVDGAILKVIKKGRVSKKLELDFIIKVRDYSVISDLKVKEKTDFQNNKMSNSKKNNKVYKCNLEFSLKDDYISIDSIRVNIDKFYLNLWGKLKDANLHLEGYSVIQELFGQSRWQSKGFDVPKRFKNLFKERPQRKLSIISEGKKDLNISNIECSINLEPSFLQIEELTFSVEDTNVFMKGDVSFFDDFFISLAASFYSNAGLDDLGGLTWIRGMNMGVVLDNDKLNVSLGLEFLDKKKGKDVVYDLSGDFKDLTFTENKDRTVHMHSEIANFYYLDGFTDTKYELFLNDFNADFNFQGQGVKLLEVNSGVYGGLLKGKGYFDISRAPIDCAFDVDIENADADKFDSLLAYFLGVSGKLDSKLYYKNYPGPQLEGSVNIRNGILEKVEYLMWLPTFFDLPLLETVDFIDTEVKFLLNKEVISLTKISLKSEYLKLKGSFDLHDNDLVTGKAIVSLAKEVLEQSPSKKALAKLFGGKKDYMDFNFQFSGTFKAINFKWLDSELREKVKSRIPDFIERSIERKIERSIDASKQ